MKQLGITILILYFSITGTYGQIMFQKTYGGLGDEVAWKVIETSDGGYLICGYTTSFGNGMEDAYIIKTDASGTEQWSKTIGGSQNDEAYSAIEDNGSYVIGGTTYSYGAGSRDGFLTRLDLSGNIIWFKTFGTPNMDYNIFRFNKTVDNGFIIAYTLNSPTKQYTLIKTNALGNVLWTRPYGGASNHVLGDIIQSPDSGYITTGFTYGYGSGQNDFLIGRADNLGNILWSKTLGTAADEGGGYYLTCLNNSEAFITGQAQNSLFGPDNIIFLKVNYLTGNIIWAKEYGKSGKTFRAFSGTPTLDNGFASDIHDYSPGGNHDMGLLKTDSVGNLLWSKKYGGSGDDVSYTICNTTDNGFALAGSTTSFGSGGKDIYFVKTDFLGNSSLTNCNETIDTLSDGLYSYNITIPILPLIPVTNINNNYNIISSNLIDSTTAFCSCLSISINQSVSTCSNQLLNLPWGGTAATTGIYSHIYTGGSGCDSTVNITLTVNQVNITNQNASTCSNQPFNLPWGGTENNAGIYSHNYTNASGCDSTVNIILAVNSVVTTSLNASTCSNQPFNLPWGGTASNAGTYSHTYTNASGCDSTVNITLAVNPVVTINLNETTCSNQPFILPWGGTVSNAGTYSHIYTNASGCDSTINITLSINLVTTTNQNVSICASQLFNLPWGGTTNIAGSYSHIYTDASGCDSTVNIILTINNATTSIANPEICLGQNYTLPDGTSVNLAGTYITTLIGSSGCDSMITTNLTESPLPPPVTLSSNTPICEGDTLNLTASYFPGVFYQWTGPHNFHSSVYNPFINNISFADTGQYHLIVSVNNCPGVPYSTHVSIDTFSFPIAVTADSLVCEETPLSLSANFISGAHYSWIGPGNFSSTQRTPVILNASPLNSGIYSLMITPQQGCKSKASSILVSVIPEPKNFILGDHIICEGEMLKLAISNPYVANYEWAGPSNFYSDKNEIVINPAFTSAGGVYSITGSSVCGIVSDTFSISITPSLDNFFLPNSFTPNSDLKNDYYYIASLENFEMKILDRWGQEIIDLTPSNRSWDGTYLNNIVPEGVYVYILKGQNCKGESVTRLGSITVIH